MRGDTPGTGAPGIEARLDLARLDRNLARLHGRAAARGVHVRAHVKGHRTAEIARRQVAAGATGIAVTQLAQARAYVAAGIDDVVIAHPWPEPWRWELIGMLARHCRASTHVNSVAAVHGLADAAERADAVLGVRVQLGTGYDATATPDAELLDIARAVTARPALRLDGVTAYQALLTAEAAKEPAATGRSTAAYAVRTARLLRAAGLPCPTVTVGGTPTAGGALSVPGVTEICSGAYALNDLGMVAVGACAPDDVALTLTVTDPQRCGEAARLLDAHPYPWQSAPDPYRPASAVPPHRPLSPPHICAVTPGLAAMTVYADEAAEHEGFTGTWQLLNEQDPAPGSTSPTGRSPRESPASPAGG
ncbi:alanine racemase [Streptomyces sp. NPDC088923]|uniref:alanine racemase n=1 Tax=Streptomyces sp. NPDC088923 TaxID=3365913 RepID=UPI0037FB6FBA